MDSFSARTRLSNDLFSTEASVYSVTLCANSNSGFCGFLDWRAREESGQYIPSDSRYALHTRNAGVVGPIQMCSSHHMLVRRRLWRSRARPGVLGGQLVQYTEGKEFAS